MIELVKDPASLTPLFPESIDSGLNELILELKGEAGKLSSSMHHITAKSVSELVLNMNSYYSNLIEGHYTHPIDIEKALKKDYSKDGMKHLMQVESAAHVKVNKAMRDRLNNEPDINICSVSFLCWLHHEFYVHLPEDLLLVKALDSDKISKVVPGELRKLEVKVGNHIAPASAAIPVFMERFEYNYTPSKIKDPIKRILAIAASHHRLAWIHPFADGNGRVVRLYSEAYFIKEGLDANGLWSISRGLAVFKNNYYTQLHNADNTRLHANDGRGNLSEHYLKEFCIFFLKTALDQVKFMTNLFETDLILDRIEKFVGLMVTRDELREESLYLLRALFLRGSVNRVEAMRIIGRSETLARPLINDLLAKGLIKSSGDREPLTINFPLNYAPYFFPKLYPSDVESTLLQ